MNYAIVFRLLGYILMIEGTLLLLPAVTSLIYAEWAVMGVFLLTAAISGALGFALQAIKPRSKVFYMREGFAATALSWITISIMGAVPFVLTGCIPNPVDAMFETVSGFTTTGASILPGVEGLPNGILFWRSFTHWIGGMGVLVFLLSLLPQFITPQHDYISRMTTLISIFAAVGLTVHLGYGFVAAIASHHLQNKRFLFWVNKVSAVLFWLLAIGVFWSLFTMLQAA